MPFLPIWIPGLEARKVRCMDAYEQDRGSMADAG